MMTPEETERLKACVEEISEILYRNTPGESLNSLEGIEQAVRQHMLEQVSPKVGIFCRKNNRNEARETETAKKLFGEDDLT